MITSVGQAMAPPSITAPLSSVSSEKTVTEEAESPIVRLTKIILELYFDLAAQVEAIAEEMKGRTLIMNDLTSAKEALNDIKGNQTAPYDASAFDMSLELDEESPAKGKTLWDLLVQYGVKKEGDSVPKTERELDALIASVDTKQAGLSSLSEATLARSNKIEGNREMFVELAEALQMRDLKLMSTILGRR